MTHSFTLPQIQPQALCSHQAPIEAILFDLDDTLWPTKPLILHAEQSLHTWLMENAPKVAALGVAGMRQRRDALIASNPDYKINLWALRQQLLHDVFAEAGEADADGERARAAMQIFANARSQVNLFADVLSDLQQLGQRWQLGSISNGFADLQQIGLASHFKVSLAAHQFGKAKPSPEIFHAACTMLGVAANTLFVGDDLLLDVQAAQQAGLRAVWLRRDLPHIVAQEHAEERRHVRAEAICADLHQVHAYLAPTGNRD